MRKGPDIVVVDDFLDDVLAHRTLALAQDYAPSEYHKGERSAEQHLSDGLKHAFEELLDKKITRWEQHGANGRFQINMAGEPIVYHSDDQSHAGALYLSPFAPPQAGTSFWKGRLTGARRRSGNQAQDGLTYDGKLLDVTAWDQVDVVGNVYNRLALWDARLIHSASCYFGNSRENGRMVQLYFFDCE